VERVVTAGRFAPLNVTILDITVLLLKFTICHYLHCP
jgi:hypothetical protein